MEKDIDVREKTSETMRMLLESVVSEGSGKNAYIEGYSIGGKTATSQTLPRSANKYISSFIGFAPADDPQILGIVIIHNPQESVLRRHDSRSGASGYLRQCVAVSRD